MFCLYIDSYVFVKIHDYIIYFTAISNIIMITMMKMATMKIMKMTILQSDAMWEPRKSRSCRRPVARIKRVKLMSHIVTMVPTLHIAKQFAKPQPPWLCGAKTTDVNRFLDKCRKDSQCSSNPFTSEMTILHRHWCICLPDVLSSLPLWHYKIWVQEKLKAIRNTESSAISQHVVKGWDKILFN